MNRFKYNSEARPENAVRPGHKYLHRDGKTKFTIQHRAEEGFKIFDSARGFWQTDQGQFSDIFITRHCKRLRNE